MDLSRHAQERCQQRGVRKSDLDTILDEADIEKQVGGNCLLLTMSRKRARKLKNDRLSRIGVIVSESTAQIVTVFPIIEGSAGKKYKNFSASL